MVVSREEEVRKEMELQGENALGGGRGRKDEGKVSLRACDMSE